MFDELWEDHPKIKQIRADSELRGELRAKLRTSRDVFVIVVKARFPELETLAQQRIAQIHNPDTISFMLQKVCIAPNADFVRWLLDKEHAS
jgi:hypothetical protein